MRGFWTDWKDEVFALRTLVLWAVLGVILGLIGPFGTFQMMTTAESLVFWGGLMAVAVPAGFVFRVWLMAALRNWPYLVRSVAVAVTFALAFTPIASFALEEVARRGLGNSVPALMIFAITAASSLGVCAVRVFWGLDRARGQGAAGVPVPVASPSPRKPRLLDRLPLSMRGEILALSVRDHYVDVRLATGSTSLLMRLADAMAETEGLDGAQVHRSHWVAWGAVTAAKREGGKLWLCLQDGARIPVSRRYHDRVSARGLDVFRPAASGWQAPAARSAPQSPPLT